MSRAGIIVLLFAAGAARGANAGDEPNPLAAVIKEQRRVAAADAAAVDALAAADDIVGWTAARERFLERLDSARKTVEDATAAALLSTKRDPTNGEGLLEAAKLSTRLADARFGYRMVSERAVKGDAGTRKVEFDKLRRNAGMAATLIEKGMEGMVSRRAQMTMAVDNLRTLVLYYIASGAGMDKPWPAFSGKRFALWLVATNKIDRTSPANLEILFSPGDATRSVDKAGGVEAFESITLDSLRDTSLDLDRFTSYAGRANADSEHRLTPEAIEKGAPLFADLSFGDVAIVAFTSGDARIMTKRDLGLDPADAIVVGLQSKAKLLRSLSDK